jgi:hypothetical protein
MEKKFDVSIRIEQSGVGVCNFSGSFSAYSTKEEIIQTLALAMDLEYEVLRPGEYLLKGQGCL